MEKLEETAITSLVIPLVKDFLIPKAISLLKEYKNNHKTIEELEETFSSYLYQRYEKFFLIETLTFPNKQTLFKVLYEPLTIFHDTNEDGPIEFKIDCFPKELFTEFFRVIIEDTGGMGKSTISQKVFLSIVEEKVGIPILIELRKINPQNSIINEIQKQLTPIGESVKEEFIFKLLSYGDFYILFDGFDEISLNDKNYVINDLHAFKEKVNNNYFMITSRPEDSLVSFGDFRKFNIRELTREESYNLIRRYDNYSYKSISEELIKRLEANEQLSLQEYLKNPLLVSLLYKAYEHKKEIPIKKSQFYGQVYDALFESHDLSKEGYFKREKYTNLHIDDFERVLRHVGYFTAIKNKVEYDKNFIINIIDEARKYLTDLNFKSSDFLKDLLNTVPLFKKDGNYYKWSHKSLQDYFCAKFIWIDAKENQKNILQKIYLDQENKRFLNILDIFSELDIKSFESTIVTWLLIDFKSYSENNYRRLKNIPQESIINRIENHYNKMCTIVVTKKEHYNKIRQVNDEDVDDEFSEYEYYKPRVNHESDNANYNYFVEREIVALTYFSSANNKDTILELLDNRRFSFVKKTKHKVHLDNDLELLECDSAYFVDDTPGNVANDPLIFDLVTDLIIGGYKLHYHQAIAKLKEIEKSNSQPYNDALTNW